MPDQAGELLLLRAAARRLGVSPNTLRAWADSGKVAVVRLPSGHRRFEARVLERMRRDMGFSDL